MKTCHYSNYCMPCAIHVAFYDTIHLEHINFNNQKHKVNKLRIKLNMGGLLLDVIFTFLKC